MTTRGLVATLIIVCTSILLSSTSLSAPPRFTPVDQLHHIHGLAVDPHDPTILYVATHGGLVRVVDGQRWEYVGDGRSDLMGFTVHPSDRGVMYVSGHPDLSSRHLPNPIGVMVSRDGGQSWQPLALAGKVDLHAMTIGADGKTLFGWNVTGAPGLYRVSTRDGTWVRVDAKGLQNVFSLAAHPGESSMLLAGTREGLMVSQDGGRAWSQIGKELYGIAVTAVEYDPRDPRILYAYAARPDLGLIKSEDGGEQWKSLGFFLGEKDAVNIFAISPHQSETLYISTFGLDLYLSRDGGKKWEPLAKDGRPVSQ